MNLFFDLDGTLTDPETGVTGCIAHALAALCVPVPSRTSLRRCIGPPLRESFAALLGTNEQLRIDRAVSLYRERFSDVGIYENEVYPGTEDALRDLVAGGHCLYVATSKPLMYAVRIVQHFRLERYFVRVYGSELSGARSNKAELLGHMLSEERLQPDQAVMIGDRAQDIAGARTHRITSIGVLWGYGSADELGPADYLVDTWASLLMRVNDLSDEASRNENPQATP